MRKSSTVQAWTEDILIPTYLPAAPDRNPMFLEKRVYQGSSGKVYPLPFTDRISERKTNHLWRVVWIENEFLKVMLLPEIGGRIHAIQDKTNGYDLIYRQQVIKPALVGLAGPWISGGIEFNWPQHHRPATFMPVDTAIEEHSDGSVTVWCSDHDPICRMKGMHGVCLHPDRAYVELKVRVCNRTPLVQTFLWWANVATRVHEAYQSFFPPDVYYVADHARRSMSEYPLAQGRYYGVDYRGRGRKGVPMNEVPAHFVPPHCLPKSVSENPHHLVAADVRRLKYHAFPQDQSLLTSAATSFQTRSKSETGTVQAWAPAYAPNDLSFYANIPVPTSYMCMGSEQDFFGGYDYKAQAGLVHIASHHISPGKKQWTWGNHDFGYAWDRNLTDPDATGEFAPYIEIMAGVYTDNQPDFSFLQPGETKSWRQYWYPIQQIGPAQHANLDAAVSLVRSGHPGAPERIRVGVSTTKSFQRASITITRHAKPPREVVVGRTTAEMKVLARFTRDLAPGEPFVAEILLPKRFKETEMTLSVTDREGREIVSYQPKVRVEGKVPPPATEPPGPQDIGSADELFVTGLHLEQYRHATRSPVCYWQEALRRDPYDARCNNAMGLWHLRRGEFTQAEMHLRRAIERLTRRNANPYDGEAFYNLGLCLRHQARDDEAYDALFKATWNQAWAGASYHALAEIDCCRQQWAKACEHAQRACQPGYFTLVHVAQVSNLPTGQASPANPRALNLWAIALRKNGNAAQADTLLRELLQTDPLDWWTRHLLGEPLTCDTQTLLDIALDLARAGLFTEAIALLGARALARFNDQPAPAVDTPETARTTNPKSRLKSGLPVDPRELGTLPLVHYYLGWLHTKLGHERSALSEFRKAAAAPPDYCFPARLEEIAILETAMRANPKDARAPYYLGNLFYDRRRHEEALRLWERSAKLDPSFSIVWRNLGIGWFNIRRQPAKARAAYDRALAANPADARLLYERDQLWKRERVSPKRRLRELEMRPELVRQRDDLSVELCALYNQTGQHARAQAVLGSRRFQPWEGGEGGPLGQHVRSLLALGRKALADGEAATARQRFEAALGAPRNLGEAKHLLANQSDIQYWLGCACHALGDKASAKHHWQCAATFQGDFQEMSVRAFSEMTCYSALAWKRLGQKARATKHLQDLLAYAHKLQCTPATIDYFATSLPAMLLFDDDLQFRQETSALFLHAQAHLGLGHAARGRRLLKEVLRRDPSHALAADFLANLPE